MNAHPDLLQYVLAYVTPEENNEDMEIVIKEYKEELDEALKHDLDHGLSIWSKEPPPRRTRAYLESTLADELEYVLDEDYLKKLQAMAVPELQSPFWAALLTLRDWVFERFAADFRRLLRASLRRAGNEPLRQ